jgi:hypothetical protein
MDALQNRKHYNDGKENWTVVIMSNTGGNKGTAAQQKNIFSLYYNKGFTTQAFNPVVSTALRIYGDVNGTGSNAGVLVQSGTTTNTNFDVPYLKALTVEYRLKLNAVPGANDNGFATNSPYIIGTQSTRGTSLTGTAGGWTSTMLWYNNTRMRFFPFQANNIIVGNPVDGAWHTYTEVMFSNNVNSKDSVRVRTYYDGVFQAAAVSAGQTVTGSAPLAIGYRPPAATNLPDFCINDIRIWKTTMTDDEVKANYNLKDATKHPYYSSMVGWWPCDEGGGDTLHSKFATTASDFVVKKATGATTQWKLINSAPATFGPANTDQLIRNTSLCPNLLYWFKVPIGTGWKPVYDNAIWLDQYLIEFSR